MYREPITLPKKSEQIDALELIVMLDKDYGIKLSDPKQGKSIFESIDTMAAYINENKTK